MTTAISANSDGGNGPFSAPKRRKIRKGTQSCWECKRRKIRCTFASPTESVCDGCRSRRVKCLSQEYHDETRLTSAPDKRGSSLDKIRSQADTSFGVKSPSVCNYMGSVAFINSPSDYNGISQQLLAAWPSQQELEVISDVNISNTFMLFHGVTCMPYSDFMSNNLPSLQDVLQPPLPGSHPVLLARRLLMLGVFLQSGSLSSSEPQTVMCRAVEIASRLVTSNDDLVSSLEGIECIMMESMFRNNAGNLRGAWVSNRRAMTMAQLMGLHQYRTTVPASSKQDWIAGPRPKAIDAETRNRIEPQLMWFRLVATDRYLSLILGLPQESQQDPYPVCLEAKEPKDYELIDRLERLVVVAAGLILQRNSTNIHNLEATLRVDKLLQEAAALPPAQWWLPPEPLSIIGDTMDAFQETLRLMYQLTHYHLLAQLHLPYILLISNDRKYDYSKMTAINASREILSRFVLYFGTNSNCPSYCRGVDFLTFIASMTLCLAHIKGHCERQIGIMSNETTSIFQFLVHQRPQDIGFVERIMESMEKKTTRDDPITQTITNSLRQLVTIEASVANQSSCIASLSCQIGCDGLESGGISMHMNNDVLHIYIPYYGTIKIERESSSHKFLEDNSFSVKSLSQMPWETLQSPTERSLIMEPTDEPNRRNTKEDSILIPSIGEEFSDWAFSGIDLSLLETI
ncbi:hypothetical protein M441DRAFT_29782 [Trichoderma asperellum CBS 433.97]|uniref:Zn(2)-C6 fungal-type domain-containing protein n=2 Tax=Trichoderma asperellum TaxID=101201 RepID=A0A2T3Z0S6_TRIA4|nr:hypothetical protein M441DRAFT_29782 [Trichoderma asperellum CBS 433.97]PTB38411.1 hypothetical protein M441DRAFT_29782 [Trichoderma asperellum CBS 433.97]